MVKPTLADVVRAVINRRCTESLIEAMLKDGRWCAMHCAHAIDDAKAQRLIVWDGRDFSMKVTPAGNTLLSQSGSVIK
jgi:hypothetical protein